MFKYLLSLTEQIRNIIQTQPETAILKKRKIREIRARRQATASNLLHIGQTAITKSFLILLILQKHFFARHTILNLLIKYCVFTSENLLLVMRPYQISACERILNKIKITSYYKKYGTIEGGGYIWHTTGSGKTLTSFKTAQLACKLECVDKVLFVVDRKDLDYQTMREYDKFEKGAANSNTSTAVLKNSSKILTARSLLQQFRNWEFLLVKTKTTRYLINMS